MNEMPVTEIVKIQVVKNCVQWLNYRTSRPIQLFKIELAQEEVSSVVAKNYARAQAQILLMIQSLECLPVKSLQVDICNEFQEKQ